jgi:hypothetical protein
MRQSAKLGDLSNIIIEIHCKKSQPKLSDDLNLFSMTLRLFKLGSVFIEKAEWDAKSIDLSHSLTTSDTRLTPFSALYTYMITSDDIPKIQELNKILRRNSSRILDRDNPIHIAFQRYTDALFNAGIVEADITTTINCLEALYLTEEENSELSHRLSQRVAAIMRCFNINPKNVYNNVKDAYKIRSRYIHGQVIKDEKRQEIRDTQLAEHILNYARISILVFIQLDSWKKKELIKIIDNSLIDNSLLDKDDYKELKEKMEKCIHFVNEPKLL